MSVRIVQVADSASQAAGGSGAMSYTNEGNVLVWDWVRIHFGSPRNYSYTNIQIDADRAKDKRPVVLHSAVSRSIASGNAASSIVIAPGERMINFRFQTTYTNEHTSANSYGTVWFEFGVED